MIHGGPHRHRRRRLATPPRTNLMAVDGRRYVQELGECSTEAFKTVSTCITDPEHGRYDQGYRCFGPRGGHPDLISYDLVEGIYKLLLQHQVEKQDAGRSKRKTHSMMETVVLKFNKTTLFYNVLFSF